MKRRTATYPRALRVNEVLRQVVAEELERLADADERFRMMTVTSVDTAPDLRTAVVYLASLSEESEAAIDEWRPHLQRFIGSQVSMKRTPRLSFKADPAVANGERIEALLRGIDRAQQEAATHTATSEQAPDTDAP